MSRPDLHISDPDLPVAVTMGDPAGVGLQITLQAWRHRVQLGLPPFVLIANADAVKAHIAGLAVAIPIKQIDRGSAAVTAFQDALPLIPIDMEAPLQLGKSDPAHAAATLNSIETAVQSVFEGETSAVVTNPITKATLTTAGFKHPGHTEFLGVLAQRWAPAPPPYEPVMMLASDELRVVPLTIHMPLCKVAATLSTDLIAQTIETIATALERDFLIAKPRIAVAGLNPHAGENATIGEEDRDVILPAVVRAQTAGLDVVGPLPADTLFHDQARQSYDAALCMYHDQALIPIKTLAFDRGVNLTLGLPFVRTSPDHGTALDIAGTNQVSAVSFCESLKMARMLARNRAAYQKRSGHLATQATGPVR